ncbi:hypothetical protein ABT404_51270, partial [Streptomyces hyaluromycini]
AFAAGFLAGLLRAETPARALRLGHLTAVSALKVTGDHGPLPEPADIARLLELTDRDWQRYDGGSVDGPAAAPERRRREGSEAVRS